MSIQFEHGIYLDQSPAEVFAVLDDLEQTPAWLKRCTGITKLTDGENHVGTKLRYSYKEPRRSGEMAGTITARIPNERLTILYTDKMMDVSVDFHISNTRRRHAFGSRNRTYHAKNTYGEIDVRRDLKPGNSPDDRGNESLAYVSGKPVKLRMGATANAELERLTERECGHAQRLQTCRPH